MSTNELPVSPSTAAELGASSRSCTCWNRELRLDDGAFEQDKGGGSDVRSDRADGWWTDAVYVMAACVVQERAAGLRALLCLHQLIAFGLF